MRLSEASSSVQTDLLPSPALVTETSGKFSGHMSPLFTRSDVIQQIRLHKTFFFLFCQFAFSRASAQEDSLSGALPVRGYLGGKPTTVQTNIDT